ncbi:hypothetical protein AWB75_05137 [Caballeronia catudaia]|uniref:Uncharacterized protein n=1 Tax=Caballeronia catudaia TaxID=1777136 RepID=A0A158CIE2_9BURK|nr:hypothetical protein AWB75_05137 [Caballeronia catudaia]
MCEMCESSAVRYAHRMTHPEYPQVLTVGCVCAGHMEGDRAQADHRDNQMRNRASSRKRWLGRKWKTSQKGNAYIEACGYRVTVHPKDAKKGWLVTIASLADRNDIYRPRRRVETLEQAKLAGFDLVAPACPERTAVAKRPRQQPSDGHRARRADNQTVSTVCKKGITMLRAGRYVDTA